MFLVLSYESPVIAKKASLLEAEWTRNISMASGGQMNSQGQGTLLVNNNPETKLLPCPPYFFFKDFFYFYLCMYVCPQRLKKEVSQTIWSCSYRSHYRQSGAGNKFLFSARAAGALDC
jgi:hypothetical protein